MQKSKKKQTVITVNVHRLLMISMTVLLCALALLSTFFLIRRFLPVSTFRIVGVSVYEREDLISASGVKYGDALYGLDKKTIEEKIIKECPYLSSVELKTKFPNTLQIEVEGRSAQWYIELSDEYYALDGNLMVMAKTIKTQGMTKLILPNVKEVVLNQVPSFGNSETEVKKTLEVVSAIRQTTFKSQISAVDLTSRWDIRVLVDGKYEVYMHDMSDFEAKLKAVEELLKSGSLDGLQGATIDASNPAHLDVKPIIKSTQTEKS